MLTEPGLDRARLAGVLGDRFGLLCHGLSFLPGDGPGWSYLASCREGRFLLKLRVDGPEPDLAGLGSWLTAAGMPVPRSVPTVDGRWTALVEGLRVRVGAYVEARLFDAEIFPAATADRLAELLARLHAIPVPRTLGLPVERYPTGGQELEAALRLLETGTGALAERAGAVVLPYADRLRETRDALERGAARGRRRRRRGVLTHGDPVPRNVLQDPAGKIWLVDWDAAAVGPRERDLAVLSGAVLAPAPGGPAGRAPALDRYRERAGGYRPDPELLGFFARRRAVGELVRQLEVVGADVDPEQVRTGLARIGWLLDRWDEMETRIGNPKRRRR